MHTDTDEPDENRPQMQTVPVTVNVACIRCFNPRKENRPATRLTFTDGGGFAVSESFDDVSPGNWCRWSTPMLQRHLS